MAETVSKLILLVSAGSVNIIGGKVYVSFLRMVAFPR